ncbi:MAG: hypothetical protein AUI99_08205 [Gemmatimonadetes bacterium 13_1_40CM_3_69_22]|nr:MAG: hypothetical protein AUI99_08205 [Gemmatimonadetes bacterium 13_1_40CM_3_69_22]OLD94403.1 MAG: hypothetical protein AUG79_08825 [Gemmatimonadetes bacterium 13_1_20CM_4_69_16]PYO15232.1 MAG: hypothetical protein DMD31_06540 [Gemmatimonadota bacterium]
MPNRVCFLVDGFNVYHSIIEALKINPTASMKWLDFQAFCSSFLPLISRDATLEKVFYFSASADFRPDKAARHAILVAALRSTGVAVQLGRFKEKDIRCPKCKTNFTRHEEKETDVAVAVKLLELLAVNACETVVLLTGDTDLAPAIRTAKTLYPDKRIWVIFPYSRHNAELKALAHGTIQVKAKRYVANQLPNPVKVSDTELIWKPTGW